jgi:hypothetical protein
VPALGGAPRLVVEAPNDSAIMALSPTWSPDGRQVASPRAEFANDGNRLFFTITEREADVWAVQLEER